MAKHLNHPHNSKQKELGGVPLSLKKYKEPVIVGIDPGITTAIAVVNFEGDVLDVMCSRNLSSQEIYQFITEHGKPVIIATDMNPPPKHVEKIATSLPARLMYPPERLKRKEKIELVRGFKEVTKKHEKDALAAAFFAFKRVRPLINKIEQKLGQNRTDSFYKEVSAGIILESKNLQSTVKQIMRKEV